MRLPIRYHAKLYCFLRNLGVFPMVASRLESSISARLHRAGFMFDKEHAPQVIRSVAHEVIDEL